MLTKIILCFICAFLTTLVVRFALRSKRDLWFARTASSIINQRGALGQYLSLGYPTCWQGLVTTMILIAVIAGEIALIFTLL